MMNGLNQGDAADAVVSNGHPSMEDAEADRLRETIDDWGVKAELWTLAVEKRNLLAARHYLDSLLDDLLELDDVFSEYSRSRDCNIAQAKIMAAYDLIQIAVEWLDEKPADESFQKGKLRFEEGPFGESKSSISSNNKELFGLFFDKIDRRKQLDQDKKAAGFFEFDAGDDDSDERDSCQNCVAWHRNQNSEIGECDLEIRDQTFRLSVCTRFKKRD